MWSPGVHPYQKEIAQDSTKYPLRDMPVQIQIICGVLRMGEASLRERHCLDLPTEKKSIIVSLHEQALKDRFFFHFTPICPFLGTPTSDPGNNPDISLPT